MKSSTDMQTGRFVADLQRVFGARLDAVVGYGHDDPATTLVLVASITADDLVALAAAVPSWHKDGLATPLVVPREEFRRSLDAFPLEFGEIAATRTVLAGADPFAELAIADADRRRACEVQVRSHLLHLRENYLECAAAPRRVAAMVTEAAPGCAGLLRLIARLDGHGGDGPEALGRWASERAGLDPRTVGDILALAGPSGGGTVDAAALFPDYLAAITRLARFVDEWRV
ncbi:MAG: hypothetical protein AB7H88_14145 [Vicinamibacterales bacterium]